jgi:cob(I)alamin adenosyltransferase
LTAGPRQKGLTILHTGEGKGKTTAALGLVVRALGHDRRVAIRQFIKGSWTPGEIAFLQGLGDRVDLRVCGEGFVRTRDLSPEAFAAARTKAEAAFLEGRDEVFASGAELLILDEALYLLHFRLLDEEVFLETMQMRPPGAHLVLTGRGATARLIEAADLVTEMRCIKHPFSEGVKAQAGIEF